MIDYLKKKYKVGLITNTDNHILRPSIKKNGLSFDFIVTSEDAKHNKPDPEIFNIALERLKLKPSEAIMTGGSFRKTFWEPGMWG